MSCAICDRVGGSLVTCTTCGMRKHPAGRDPGLAAANGYCPHECPGNLQPPHPESLWPGEKWGDAFGHEAWHEAAAALASEAERAR
jgi:hypothetical protein